MLYVGIDDTDSKEGMCTTYLAFNILKSLEKIGIYPVDLPSLIRLNPNIPYKTRGNGAVCLKFSSKDRDIIKEVVLKNIAKLSMIKDEETNPGVVFYEGKLKAELVNFSLTCIRTIVSQKTCEKLLNKLKCEYYKFKNGRGIIGATAAIGYVGNFTYELLVYRDTKEERKVENVKKNEHFNISIYFQ